MTSTTTWSRTLTLWALGALTLVGVLTILVAGPAGAAGNDIFVDAGNMNLVQDGDSWDTAYSDLQDALNDVDLAPGDQILVAEGIYTPDTIDPTVSFRMVDGVEVIGGFPEDGGNTSDPLTYETILSGDLNGDDGVDANGNPTNTSENSESVVRSAPGAPIDSVLSSVTVTAGFRGFENNGGGIQADTPLTIDNVRVIGNSATFSGGGISIRNDGVVVRNSVIEGNTVTSTSFGNGAGVFIAASPTIENTEIRDNAAASRGGGIHIASGSPLLTNLTIEDNSAVAGGGISSNGPDQWQLSNSLIARNDAPANGGGVFVFDGNPTITNSTIVDNTGNASSSGIFFRFSVAEGTLQNTIVWDNEVSDIRFSDVVVTHSNAPDLFPGTGNTSVDPQFIDPSNGDYRLDLSALIDAGDSALAPPGPDLGNNPRIVGSAVDMGAYEGGTAQSPCPAGFFVDNSLQTAVDGLSWGTAFTDVQDALDIAGTCSGGATINIATGTYTPSDNDETVSFELINDVTLIGGWATQGTVGPDNDLYPTILSGDLPGGIDNSHHVFTADRQVDWRLENLTISDGNSPDDGGGLFVVEASGSLSQVTIEDNVAASRGGGVWSTNGAAIEIRESTISGNSADDGGGIAVGGNGLVNLLSSSVEDNLASSDGGGLWINNGAFPSNSNIFTSEFTGNSAGGDGGGVYSFGSRVDFASLVVVDNEANRGGGMFLDDDGENFSETQYPLLNSLTIASNTASSEAGGLWIENYDCFECSPDFFGDVLQDLIVFHNSAPNVVVGGDIVGFGNSNIEGSGGSANWDGSLGFDNGGNIDEDPAFFDLPSGEVSLAPGSPSIDTGGGPGTLEDEFDLDQDGDVFDAIPAIDLTERVQGAATDMGAFERAPGAEPLVVTSVTACPIYDSRDATGGLAGALNGGESRTIQVSGTLPAGQGVGTDSCVPETAMAATVIITAADAQAGGNLRVVPAGNPVNGGVVNYAANELNNTNTVTIPLSADGKVDISANGGLDGLGSPSADVRVVAVGFSTEATTTGGGGGGGGLSYVGVTPCAVADSRPAQGSSGAFVGPFTVGDDYPDIDIIGTFPAAQGGGNTDCEVPADAVGVVANLVAVNPTGVGTLSAAAAPLDPDEPTTAFAPIGTNNATTFIVTDLQGESVAIDIDGDPGATVNVRVVVFGYLIDEGDLYRCLLYTSPSPRDKRQSRMPSSA